MSENLTGDPPPVQLSDLGPARCAEHADRPMQAVCQGCQRTLCVECTNKVGGINFCADCLPIPPKLPRTDELEEGRSLRRVGVVVALLLTASLAVGYGIGRPLIEGFTTAERNERYVQEVQRALYSFHLDFDRWPTVDEGLAVLVEKPEGLDGWDGPYLFDTELTEDGEVLDAYDAPLFYWWEAEAARAYIVSSGPNRSLDSIGLGTGDPQQGGDDILLWTDDLSYLD